jgi:hypothetical protein
MDGPSCADPNFKYTVFFSHKIGDGNVTRSIIDLLDSHTEQVKYFISERIEKGIPWRKAIAEQLNISSFLVLVFTDPTENWGWCLYETGFFDALSQIPTATQKRRIICLHHPLTAPPSPIADLQAVPAKVDDVSQWLEELFDYTEQTKQIHRKQIPQIADEICRLFSKNSKIYAAKSIDLIVNCSSLITPDDLPEDTTIDGDRMLMEELFGTNTGSIKWKSVKDRFVKFAHSSEANFNALKEISRAIYNIYNNNRVLPVQGTLFVDQGPKRYRPVISYANDLSAEQIHCEVLLIEEVGGPLQNVDRPFGALLTSIRMAVRIRWEIVHPFFIESNVRELADDARKLRFDLQTCFNNIFIEAEFRGNYSPQDVLRALESNEDKAKMRVMIKEWEKVYKQMWQSMGFDDVMETFTEVSDQPFTEQDIASLEAGMARLEKMNSEFLEMAGVRVTALIHRELAGC